MAELQKNFDRVRLDYRYYTEQRMRENALLISFMSLDQMNEWGTNGLSTAQEQVVGACEVMGIKRVNFRSGLGSKGAGKGSNFKAISEAALVYVHDYADSFSTPQSLQRVIDSFSGKTMNITTGTGGMLFMPKEVDGYGVYARLAKQLDSVTGAGKYVDDQVTSSMFFNRVAWGISMGFDSFSGDLHPRTLKQYKHTRELFRIANEAGIETNLSMIYLTLLPEDRADNLRADRVGYATEAKRFSAILKNWVKENRAQLATLSDAEQLEGVEEKLSEMETEGDERTKDFAGEVRTCNERSGHRLNSAGSKGEKRSDERPLETVSRVASDLGAAGDFLPNEEVPIVSAYPKIQYVVPQVITAMIGSEAADSPGGKKFIEVAQKFAVARVENISK